MTEPTFSLLKFSDTGESATADATATSVPATGIETDLLAWLAGSSNVTTALAESALGGCGSLGANSTTTVHVPPGISDGSVAAVHVELGPTTKSAAFAPVSCGPAVIKSSSLPVFVSVTVNELGSVCPCEVSGKLSDDGLSVIPKPVPVPRKFNVCGLPIPSSVT